MSINSHYLPHIAERVLNTPLLITEGKLMEILWALGGRIGISLEGEGAKPTVVSNRIIFREAEIVDSVGVIPIQGTLVHRAMDINALSGLTDYPSIKATFQDMQDDSRVRSILFDIDSQGGEIAGLFDLVDFIYNSRGQKPIIAVANEKALSAAYAIASAVDKVFLPRTAIVGSIGVIGIHVDRSQKNEKEGVKYTPIYAGAQKNNFSPNAPLSDSAKALAQTRVDSLYDLFVSTVARNNNISESDIRSQEAAEYAGKDAIQAGLADDILTYDEAFQYAKQEGGSKMATRNTDPKQTTVVAQPQPQPEEKTQEQLREEMKAQLKEELLTEMKGTFQQEILQAERARVVEITALCEEMGVPELTTHYVNEGFTADSTRASIQEVLAKQSQATNITNINQNQTESQDLLLKDAEKRLEAFGQKGPLV